MKSTVSLLSSPKFDWFRVVFWRLVSVVVLALILFFYGGCTVNRKIDFVLVDSVTSEPIKASAAVERSTKNDMSLLGGVYELSSVDSGEGPYIRNVQISSRDTLSFRSAEYCEARVRLDGSYVLVLFLDSKYEEPFNILSQILENNSFDTRKTHRVKIQDNTVRIPMKTFQMPDSLR